MSENQFNQDRVLLLMHVRVHACVCAFMLFALNFDKYVFVENV